MSEERFPIQDRRVTSIKYEYAKLAYTEYALRYGTDQSLKRLGERGGFGIVEVVELLVGLVKRQGKDLKRLRQ